MMPLLHIAHNTFMKMVYKSFEDSGKTSNYIDNE